MFKILYLFKYTHLQQKLNRVITWGFQDYSLEAQMFLTSTKRHNLSKSFFAANKTSDRAVETPEILK